MATITEDYVSFDTAKLLKEKGFKEYCDKSYSIDGTLCSNFPTNCILAPTLQMAMKWLMKTHHIHIQVLRYPAKVKRDAERTEYSKPWFYKYTRLTELEDIDTDFLGEEEFETSEEAIDGGIKYCLENLI